MYNGEEVLTVRNCITDEMQELNLRDGAITNIPGAAIRDEPVTFIGPGLIDLQINGINGIDFNDPSVTTQDIAEATHYLFSKGITTFLPTVITNSDENILEIVRTIHNACLSDPIVKDCIWGIHLEGPFISPVTGAKGAHDEQYIKAPDWQLFSSFQEAAGGKIKLVTIAPEWEGSWPFNGKFRADKDGC